MFITVVNSKGGVGKTTLSVHIAGWLAEQGLRVAMVDADEQQSTQSWMKQAAHKLPVFEFTSSRQILEQSPKLKGWYDAVVADGPAALCAKVASLASVADVCVMPLLASMLDVWASYRTARVLHKLRFHPKREGFPRVLTVLNRVNERSRLAKVAREAAHKYGFPVCPYVVQARQPFAEACERGSFVWKLGRKAARATAEINRVCEQVLLQVADFEAARRILEARGVSLAGASVVAQAEASAQRVLPADQRDGVTPTPPAEVTPPAARSDAPRSTG